MTIPESVARANAQIEPGEEPHAFTEEQLEAMRQAVAEDAEKPVVETEAPPLRQYIPAQGGLVAQGPLLIPRLGLIQQLHSLLEGLAVAQDATGRLPSVAWEGAEGDPEAQIREAIAEADQSLRSAYRKILAVAGLLAIER